MSTPKGPPLPWWPRDFATDEHVALMTWEEQGIYRHLLDMAWLHGSIPADPAALAKLCRNIHLRSFRKVWAKLSSRFIATDGNPCRLTNGKLERVRVESEDYRKSQSDKGKRGAKARWNRAINDDPRHPPAISQPHDKPIADPMAESWPPTPTPTPTLLQQQELLTDSPLANGSKPSSPKPPKTPLPSWPAEAAALYAEHIGLRSPGEFGRYLAPAVKAHGWPLVRRWLLSYCNAAPYRRRDGTVWGDSPSDTPGTQPLKNARGCSPKDFADTLAQWRERTEPLATR